MRQAARNAAAVTAQAAGRLGGRGGGPDRHPRVVSLSHVRSLTLRARQRPSRRTGIVLAVALVLVVLVGYLFLFSPVLAVTKLQLIGGDRFGTPQLQAIADNELGMPLARVDLADLQRRIAAEPAVKSAQVVRVWPNTLEVRVTERTPVLVVPVVTKSAGNSSGGPDSTGPDSTGPDSTGPESAGPDSTGPESTGTGSTSAGSAGTGSTGTGSAGTDSTGTDSTGTDSTGTDSTGAGSAGTGSTRTGSTGTGSTGTGSSAKASTSPAKGYQLMAGDGVVIETVAEAPENLPTASDDTVTAGKAAVSASAEVMAALPDTLRGQVTEVTALSRDSVQLAMVLPALASSDTEEKPEKAGKSSQSGTQQTRKVTVVWGGVEDSALKAEVLAVVLKTEAKVYDVSSPSTPVTRDSALPAPQVVTPSASATQTPNASQSGSGATASGSATVGASGQPTATPSTPPPSMFTGPAGGATG